jgi:RNA polymerase sigma factor (sigma-70 family)
MTAESSLGELLSSVNQAVDRVLRRRRKGKDFADDFRGWVMLKMLERDGAILKQFRGESALMTYLRVVVDRMYCDYLISLNGKWRPSKMAAKLGAKSVQLERLVYHDGYTLDQAIAVLQTREGNVRESELRDGFVKIPYRRTRFFVGLDSLSELHADTRFSAYAILRQKEIDDANRLIRDALGDALAELPDEDLRILELRFCQGLRISDLSRKLGLKQRSAYRRCSRILRVLRKKLEAIGVRRNSVRGMAEGSLVPQQIEGAFAEAARCVSNTREPEMLFEACREPFLRETETFSMSV